MLSFSISHADQYATAQVSGNAVVNKDKAKKKSNTDFTKKKREHWESVKAVSEA